MYCKSSSSPLLFSSDLELFQVARQRKAYYEIIQTAIEDSFERCPVLAQRNSIVIHLQHAFRCVTRNVIAVLGMNKGEGGGGERGTNDFI